MLRTLVDVTLSSLPVPGVLTTIGLVLWLARLGARVAADWLAVALPTIDWWQTRRTRWDPPPRRKRRSRDGSGRRRRKPPR